MNEKIGTCEGCAAAILEGDAYLSGECMLCAECCPTYGDLQAHPELFQSPDDEPHTAESVAPVIAAHIAAGGSLSDKLIPRSKGDEADEWAALLAELDRLAERDFASRCPDEDLRCWVCRVWRARDEIAAAADWRAPTKER